MSWHLILEFALCISKWGKSYLPIPESRARAPVSQVTVQELQGLQGRDFGPIYCITDVF